MSSATFRNVCNLFASGVGRGVGIHSLRRCKTVCFGISKYSSVTFMRLLSARSGMIQGIPIIGKRTSFCFLGPNGCYTHLVGSAGKGNI